MATAKPFSWTVRFTVAPLWVQDGFTISNDRALEMLARAVGAGSADELQAQVLIAPSPRQIVKVQGYIPGRSQRTDALRTLRADTEGAGQLAKALLDARALLDSVAFVSQPGDTTRVLAQLDEALNLIDPRRGDAVEIEL